MAKIEMRLRYDTETFRVEMVVDNVTIGLGQMMLHEALAQLDEKRRLAFINQLQAEAQESAMRAAIAGKTKTREV